jgi:hypothetical protein
MTVEFVPVIDSPEDKPQVEAAADKSAPAKAAAPVEGKRQTDASAKSAKVAERTEQRAQAPVTPVSVPLPKARPVQRKP